MAVFGEVEISIKPDACRAGALPPGPLLMTTLD